MPNTRLSKQKEEERQKLLQADTMPVEMEEVLAKAGNGQIDLVDQGDNETFNVQNSASDSEVESLSQRSSMFDSSNDSIVPNNAETPLASPAKSDSLTLLKVNNPLTYLRIGNYANPLEYMAVKRKWFKKLGIEDPSLEYGFVCSRHFKTEDYIRDLQAELLGYIGRRKLKPYAVPSLHLPNGSFEISEEEKERLQREKHEQIIRDCLNESGQNKTILSFDLFKKLRYSNSRTRKSKSSSPSRWYSDENPEDIGYNINPRGNYHLDDENSQMIVVKLPTGEKHYVNIEPLQDPLGSIKQEDTSYEIDSVEDMHAEEEYSMDDALDEPMYLRRKVKKLEAEVQEQKKEICTLRRQIVREKKMMEKIVLATNSGKTWPIANKKRFDAKSRSALLDIYSLAPTKYPSFSRILNLPAKQVLASWDPKICHPTEQDTSQKEVPEEIAEDDFQEQDFVEEEYVIESEEYVQE